MGAAPLPGTATSPAPLAQHPLEKIQVKVGQPVHREVFGTLPARLYQAVAERRLVQHPT